MNVNRYKWQQGAFAFSAWDLCENGNYKIQTERSVCDLQFPIENG